MADARADEPDRSPDAVVVQPGTIVPGRARGAAPLRREGPAKLTGAAKYADDFVVPGAWYGETIRSTDAHARLLGLEPDPAFDWSTVVLVTAADIPGDNIVSSIKADQPIAGPDRWRDPAPRRAARADRRAGPGDAPRGAARDHGAHGAAAAGLRPARARSTSSPVRARARRSRAGLRGRRPRSSRASTGSGTRSSCTSRTTR